MAIVGVPDAQGDEKVAALVVLTDDAPEDAMGVVRSHFNDVAVGLSNHQKLRLVKFWSEELPLVKFWSEELPRTATRKVKRKEVRAELIRLIEVEKGADREDSQVPSGREPAWLYAAIAGLVGQEATDILPHTDLISDLGLSSLQTVELRLLIEERGGVRVDADDMAKCETVEDLASVVRGGKPLVKTHQPEIVRRDDGDYDVPGVISEMGRNVLKAGQKALYERAFDVRLEGEDNIPYNEQCIVVANHSSHIDAGLAKYALWDYAPELSPLAASDYFFDTKEKRGFFEPFTNLIPVDRSQPTERSLREAERAIQQGRVVLVFPEGTRSKDGQLQEFKHGIGYLMRKTRRPVLPLYMRGSHRALPKGAAMPRSRRLTARIGPIIRWEDLGPEIDQMEAPEVYKAVADKLHEAICALRDGTDYPWKQPAPGAEKKKQSGLADVFDELPERFDPNLLDKPITWYFSLGDRADGKWTVRVSKDGANIQPGKPNGGKADCVLKTDPRTFEKIVRERYVPSFAEFAEGKVKTNDPDLLRMFQTVFQL
jgi:long-chain acyl-CoA synthetase